MTQNLEFTSGRTESTVEKGENAGYQHFSSFLQIFQESPLLSDCVVTG